MRKNAVVDDAGQVYLCFMFDEFSHITGPRLATPRGGAAYFTLSAGSISISRSQHNLISIFLGTVPDLQVAVGCEKPRMLDATPGTVVVAPTGSAVESSWNDRRESILLVIPDGSFDAIIAEEGGHGRDVFDRSPYKTYDRRVLGAAEQIRSELSKSHANELLIGSLITVIGGSSPARSEACCAIREGRALPFAGEASGRPFGDEPVPQGYGHGAR